MHLLTQVLSSNLIYIKQKGPSGPFLVIKIGSYDPTAGYANPATRYFVPGLTPVLTAV